MVLIPKDNFKQYPFVDREDYIQTFKEAVNSIGQKEFSILVYHGIAGIGKTSLRKELPKYLEEYNLEYPNQKLIWASIDLQLEEFRKKTTFLLSLKNELQKKTRIKFPAFEIAHAIYWKKKNPEIPLRKENYLLFEGDDAFDSLFGVVDQIPYFSLVPVVARLMKNLPDDLRKWWKMRGEEELFNLSEKEPLEIEEMLPYFWVQDFNNYLEDATKSAVLFIDTYEALRENCNDDGYSSDEWIREELIFKLPKKVLWIICGREAFRWMDTESNFVIQYKVEKLSRKYCTKYLETRGVTDREIQEIIFKGSKGVPYYLELSVHTYKRIIVTRQPKPEDFGDNHRKITDRFFRFLSDEDKEVLNVLSIPRFWDYDLFKYLVKEFNIGYSTNNYEDLCTFSFIGETEKNKRQMHKLMQQCIQKNQEQKRPDSVKRIHKAINDYYSNKLENINIKSITLEHEISLAEAFYHAKEILESRDLLNWFIAVSQPFDKAAFWKLIIPMYEEILQILEVKQESEQSDIVVTLSNLAQLYIRVGKYEKALPLHIRAIEISEKEFGPEDRNVANTLNGLAALYHMMGKYEKALPLYMRALKIYKTVLNDFVALYKDIEENDKEFLQYIHSLEIYEEMLGSKKLTVATTLNNLAALYCQMGEYEKALPLYQSALEISEEVLGPEHLDIATTLNGLALLYEQIEEYEMALPLYLRALKIKEKVLGPEHPDIAKILNNLAMLYDKTEDYEKELLLYTRALEISEEALGPEHPDVAIKLHNLAGFYRSIEEYEAALSLYMRALDIRTKAFGAESLDVAATLNALAGVFYQIEDYETALLLYISALNIREKALGPENLIVADTLNNLALLYARMKEYKKALSLLERSLRILEKKVGCSHSHFKTCKQNIQAIKAEMEENRDY